MLNRIYQPIVSRMQMLPKISVIIPVHNNENIISGCLNRVFAQDYPNYEVIVANDCSADKTADIARRYPCRVVDFPRRRGPGFARDKAVMQASGDIVAFLDSDCLVPADWLSRIERALNPEIVGMGGRYELPAEMSLWKKLLLIYADFRYVIYRKRRRVAAFPGGNCAFWRQYLLKPRPKREMAYFNKRAGGEDIVMCCELGAFGILEYDPGIVVLHDKKGSIGSLLKSFVWYGYTGAIFSPLFGRILAGEAYRRYKTLALISSAGLVFSLLFIGRQPFAGLWVFFMSAFFLLQVPLAARSYGYSGLRWGVLFLPLAAFVMDMLHFLGGLICMAVSLRYALIGIARRIRAVSNILDRRALTWLFLFVTKECNAGCNFCFNKHNPEVYLGSKNMSLEEIGQITAHIPFLPFLTISGGEPFLRDDIEDIVTLFYRNCRTRYITIATNGILTNRIMDSVEAMLIDNHCLRLTLAVALDHIGPRHGAIRGVGGAFEYVGCSLRQLNILKGRFPRLTVSINTLLLAENASEIKTILVELSNMFAHDRHSLNLLRQPRKSTDTEELIGVEDYFSLVEEINRRLNRQLPPFQQKIRNGFLKHCHERARREFINRKPVSRCLAGRKFAVIANDGGVYPCELLLDQSGSLRKHDYDIGKIINGPRGKERLRKIEDSGCYCRWPCAVIMNSLMHKGGYFRLLRYIIQEKAATASNKTPVAFDFRVL